MLAIGFWSCWVAVVEAVKATKMVGKNIFSLSLPWFHAGIPLIHTPEQSPVIFFPNFPLPYP